ncbi:MAG: 50S ribosomal protein L23 [Deltaproteobacteria bacterium]|nr:50S ribosomal protein L23 [Deltaproteobacteria bacterium]
MRKLIKYPHVTEKASNLQSNLNQYVFVVEKDANKFEIKKAVEALKKNIEIESIRTVVVRGKVKRLGMTKGKRSNWKKAIVRLKEGQSLELFEAV